MDDKTLGESRVLVTYRDEENANIQQIRQMAAGMIDFLETHKQSRITAIGGEHARVYAHSMTMIEDACMWSIKAICK